MVFSLTGLGIVWLLASVGHVLFAPPNVRLATFFSGKPDDLDAQLTCQADVETLFDDLNRKLFDLQNIGARYDIELGVQWEAFCSRWRQRWLVTGARCRFSELRNHGLGPAYDRLATVYDELEDMQRAYAVLLYHYIDHRASQVSDIRHALSQSRRDLEKLRDRTAAPHAG